MYLNVLVLLIVCIVSGCVCFAQRSIVSRLFTAGGHGRRLGIYNGTKTTIEEHAYLVGLVDDLPSSGRNYSKNTQVFYCAGSIVSSSWVVTIAECLYDMKTSYFTIVAGSMDGTKGTVYNISKFVLHPRYKSSFFDYNYGLVKIEGKFKWSSKVKPTRLPKSNPIVHSQLVVAGWGNTGSRGVDQSIGNLRQGKMKWLSQKACAAEYPRINWTDRMACAFNKGKTTCCLGDQGDAFIRKGVFYGMYVAVYDKGACTSEASPVILANIYPGVSWIKNITGARYEDE